MPKSRQDYWKPKIARNKSRDKLTRARLEKADWRVHRIWEHSLNEPSSVVARLMLTLKNAAKQTRRAS